MTYRPTAMICRKCIEENVSDKELAAYLDGYVNSLPDEMRAAPEVYEERLRICEMCDKRIAFTCTLCGCYIQARAAKRKMQCPNDVGGPKW